MEDYSVQEIVEQAVQTEKLGYDFYSRMARKFEKDEQLKRLFDTLAAKEREHERVFSGLKEKVADQRLEMWEEASQYLRAIVESEFFLGANKALPSLDHIQSTKDAVRYAISFEKDTLLYFHFLRDVVKEKEIVDEIINEEKSHIVWLSDYRKTLVPE